MNRLFKFFGIFITCALAVLLCSLSTSASASSLIRVGLVREFQNRDVINISNTQITIGVGNDGGFTPIRNLNSASGFSIRATGGRVFIQSGNSILHNFDTGANAQIVAPDGGFIYIGDNPFRGAIEFRAQGNWVSAINVLTIEEYLYSVVPAEMFPNFHLEALKAHAVAARTFAYNQIMAGGHHAQGFDLCDGVHCQVYNGAGNEHENTTRAVSETSGLMLFYGGETILATYHSSSGGATDNSEDVWFEARPYLRSVNSLVEHEPLVWTRTFTWAQLTQAANAAGADIGSVNGFSVSRLAVSGNVTEITLHGTDGNWTVNREPIRNFFSPIGGQLPSRNFRVQGAAPMSHGVSIVNDEGTRDAVLNHLHALDSRGIVSPVHMAYVYNGITTRRINSIPAVARDGTGITLQGRGWGHGVGMSQRGAEGMARLGHSFMEILLHYYTGVEIRRG